MTMVSSLAAPAAGPAASTAAASWPIEQLWQDDRRPARGDVRGGPLPADLQARFGPRLEIPLHPDRPTVIANFVSTLDGVVALDRSGRSGGGDISGGFEPDRFVMGLLRATADAVLVGAGTVRASRSHSWTPGQLHPTSAPGYAAWRAMLGLATPEPTTVVVTASGRLHPEQLEQSVTPGQVLVVTTTTGADRLRAELRRPDVDIVAVADGRQVPVERLVELLRDRGLRLVLSEAGPTLFGQLLAAHLVDELFLTVAPQAVGRSDHVQRLGLVDGVSFPPALAPWARLRGVMRSGDHLFLRYRFDRPNEQASPRS
jgi:riboflavin biosynthesis pyrimidine reductase